MKICERSKTFC